VLEHSAGNISKALGIIAKGMRANAQPARCAGVVGNDQHQAHPDQWALRCGRWLFLSVLCVWATTAVIDGANCVAK
jgi:hypothetical protein